MADTDIRFEQLSTEGAFNSRRHGQKVVESLKLWRAIKVC